MCGNWADVEPHSFLFARGVIGICILLELDETPFSVARRIQDRVERVHYKYSQFGL